MKFPSITHSFVIAAAVALLTTIVVPATEGAAMTSSAVTMAQSCINPHSPAPTPPSDDPFYSPPDPIPSGAPGTVLRSRPVCITEEEIGLPYKAWQVMYLSTGTEDANGTPSALNAAPAVDVATIIEPLTPAATSPRPLVSFQMAEDAVCECSAPSYTLRVGDPTADSEDGTQPWPALLSLGFAVVVPDYEGVYSEFGAVFQEAHAVLDGIRAAENFAPAGLAGTAGAPTPVGLWGYSGGSLATGWAAELAASYAPDLHIVGVAEGGVPANLKAGFDNVNGGVEGYVALLGSVGTAIAYPNLSYDEKPNPGNDWVGGPSHTGLDTVANTAGQAIAAELEQGRNNAPNFANIDNYTWCGCNPVDNPTEFPGIAELMTLENMGQPNHVPNAPMYIYQAYFDELIPFATVQTLVNSYCSEGVNVTFRVDYASEHALLYVDGSPEAIAYLASRFDGVPAASTCGLPNNAGPPLNPPVSTGGTGQQVGQIYSDLGTPGS